jgi:molybdate transport system ATP-binding protein
MLRVAVTKQLGSFGLEVRFELPTPGVVALFGPSGCGKSTTVNIIAGLLEADRGRVMLDDALLLDTDQRIDVAAERRRIACVFQDARLFPHLSVAANLKYAEKRAVGRHYVNFDAVAELLNLESLMHRHRPCAAVPTAPPVARRAAGLARPGTARRSLAIPRIPSRSVGHPHGLRESPVR